ncbi:universal stress protein [Natrinema gelatinilyticum]|uniref:universal stress protein n=1 Tax=Natrinema gelatinilyticum TaxID=2961571 RepID=UPI0020C41C68|nr:universal stress protein [Natrinema gelatinilyticum]
MTLISYWNRLFESNNTGNNTRSDFEGEIGEERVLAPLLSAEESATTDQLRVAVSLAKAKDATLIVIDVIVVPWQMPFVFRNAGGEHDRKDRLDTVLDQFQLSEERIIGSIQRAQSEARGVLQLIDEFAPDTLVLPKTPPSSPFYRRPTEAIVSNAPTDVVVVTGKPDYNGISSILLPVSGGPHTELAIEVSRSIATSHDAWIDVFHVIEEKPDSSERDTADSIITEVKNHFDELDRVSGWIFEADDASNAIIEQSRYYDLTVIGAPTQEKFYRVIYRSTAKAVRKTAQTRVILVQCSH